MTAMHNSGIFTLIAVLLLVAALIYQLEPLRRTKIWHLSIQQLIHLVLIPGLIFPMIFTYLQNIVRSPQNSVIVLNDGLLVNGVLLSMLFGYGGIAIHAVTKMLSDYLKDEQTEVAEINKFFHLIFSHNMAFAGIIAASLGITLLEVNHIPMEDPTSIGWGVLRGILLGFSFGLATYNYARYSAENYRGRWSDLKVTFGVAWVGFVVLLYIVQKLDIGLSEYQLLLPILLSFSFMTFLSLILVLRRVKRGGWRLSVGKKKLQKYLTIEDMW